MRRIMLTFEMSSNKIRMTNQIEICVFVKRDGFMFLVNDMGVNTLCLACSSILVLSSGHNSGQKREELGKPGGFK